MLLSAPQPSHWHHHCQACLGHGARPFSGASWRVAISVLAYLALMVLVPTSWMRKIGRSWVLHAENDWPSRVQFGTLGMLIGMTLFIWALSIGDAGIVAAVASTAPLVQLPGFSGF